MYNPLNLRLQNKDCVHYVSSNGRVKVKLSRYRPEQALGGSGRLRLLDFYDVRHHESGRSLALRNGRLYPQKCPGTYF